MKFRWARVVFVLTLLAAGLAAAAGHAPEARAWVTGSQATIHPGVQTVSNGAQCTANFVFTYTPPFGQTRVFIGQAAHCTGKGGPTDTNGCVTPTHPIETPVSIQGASRPGRLHYSSWVTMQERGERNPDVCQYNDFALVEVHPNDVRRVNPSMPFWGGPKGMNTTGTSGLSTVYSYGNSGLRLGLTPLSPKIGTSLGTFAGGWAHQVYTATPGIPGDSGSALLDEAGRAAGVAATISPLGSNNYTDLNHALAYARDHAHIFVRLANSTSKFNGL